MAALSYLQSSMSCLQQLHFPLTVLADGWLGRGGGGGGEGRRCKVIDGRSMISLG